MTVHEEVTIQKQRKGKKGQPGLTQIMTRTICGAIIFSYEPPSVYGWKAK
jgi:hypothetical protein